MSRIKMDLIWQHEQVLPYILGELKQQVERITPVHAMYLHGSRARVPLHNWQRLEGKDWDVLVVCSFPIVNTQVWTLDRGYYIDLQVITKERQQYLLRHGGQFTELYPHNKFPMIQEKPE